MRIDRTKIGVAIARIKEHTRLALEFSNFPLAAATRLGFDFLNLVPEEWKQKSFEIPTEIPTEIPEGQRTDYMVKMVCSMQAKGASDNSIRVAVRAENEARCIPPLTDPGVGKAVNGGWISSSPVR